MKFYKIPFDIKHEEKIFGGYLSLRQFLYLLLTVFSSVTLFINIKIWIRFLIFFALALIWILFAFFKIDEIRFDKYIINALKYVFRKKRYGYER